MDERDLVKELQKPFELTEHNIRKGQGSQWFVYVKKQAIMDRLDSLVPMGWQTDIVETVRIDNRVEVVMSMRILNTTRSFDGVADDTGKNALMTRKAATTDAFKRVAMLFGIGRYLLDVDKNTSNNEADAKHEFAAWYNKRFAATTQQGSNGNSPPPAPTEPAPKDWNEDINQVTSFISWCKTAMIDYDQAAMLQALNDNLDTPIVNFASMKQYPGSKDHAADAVIAYECGYDDSMIAPTIARIMPGLSGEKFNDKIASVTLTISRAIRNQDARLEM